MFWVSATEEDLFKGFLNFKSWLFGGVYCNKIYDSEASASPFAQIMMLVTEQTINIYLSVVCHLVFITEIKPLTFY